MVDKSQRFITLVRVGFAARGLTYMLLGWLALEASRRVEGGNEAVFGVLDDWTFGTVLLWIVALGLLAYAMFKFLCAIGDIMHRGADVKGIAERIGDAASGIAYAILAYAAYQFAAGHKDVANDATQETARSVLSMNLGSVAIGLVGLGFLAGAAMQARHAITARFMRHLSSRAPHAAKWVGQAGHAARAVVFAIIGWSLVEAAWIANASEVKGVGQALASLREHGELYTLTALGLILFGAFSLVMARFSIIPDFDADSLRPNLRI